MKNGWKWTANKKYRWLFTSWDFGLIKKKQSPELNFAQKVCCMCGIDDRKEWGKWRERERENSKWKYTVVQFPPCIQCVHLRIARHLRWHYVCVQHFHFLLSCNCSEFRLRLFGRSPFVYDALNINRCAFNRNSLFRSHNNTRIWNLFATFGGAQKKVLQIERKTKRAKQ